MTVSRILAAKGRCVVTTRTHRTLHEIVAELALHEIGALVVVDLNDEVVGLISERDVIAALAANGIGVMQDAVERHMVKPRVMDEKDSIEEAMETMTQERRRHLPVMREGRLSGIISVGDVVKFRLETIENEHKALRDYIATA
jgi:CBS domain-containing protein